MKIAIINYSGNVGKSTIARHLFAPRIKNAQFISVESINADEADQDMIRGKQFGVIQEQLMATLNSAIVDIGASNVEDFMKLMREYRGSHEDFNYYIIPVVKETKQIKDSIATIQSLASMGVNANKIRIIFNKLDIDESLEDAFFPIISFYQENKIFKYNSKAVLRYSDIYQKLRSFQVSMQELLDDKTDYKAILSTCNDPQERTNAASMISLQRLAISAKENLDEVYKATLN